MDRTILTVGYNGGWTPELLARELTDRRATLLDIRHNPTSMKPEWRREALRRQLGDRYMHIPALGNVNYQGGPIQLAEPDAALIPVRRLLAHGPVVLLCACPNWQTCHRKQAADFLAQCLNATIEHLAAPVTLADGTLPALTLTAPYGTLIQLLAKCIETRNWQTSYRGRIAIHQGAGLGPVGGKRGLTALCGTEPFRSVLLAGGMLWEPGLPLGAVIATAELVDCVPTGVLVQRGEIPRHTSEGVPVIWQLTEQERAFGDYSPGRFAWLLTDVRPLAEPIPARGALGLWKWQPPTGVQL